MRKWLQESDLNSGYATARRGRPVVVALPSRNVVKEPSRSVRFGQLADSVQKEAKGVPFATVRVISALSTKQLSENKGMRC